MILMINKIVNITQSFLLMSLVPYLERRQQNDMCTQYKHTDKNNNITHTKHNKLMFFFNFYDITPCNFTCTKWCNYYMHIVIAKSRLGAFI